MGSAVLKCLLLLTCVLSTHEIELRKNDNMTSINGDTGTTQILNDETRESRASRRVVKLYSGARPKPIECNGEGFQADPYDCSTFHRCIKSGNGRFLSFKFQCGPGTIYDPDSEICNHAASTKRTACGGNLIQLIEQAESTEMITEIPSPISTKKLFFTHRQSDNILNKHPEIKNQPIKNPSPNKHTPQTVSAKPDVLTDSTIKENMSSITKSKPSSPTNQPFKNLNINSATSITVNNRPNSQSGEMCTSDGFMGDTENCHKFYRCVSNRRGGFIRYEFVCSDPTVWDDDKQACNHAWLVKKRRCGRESSINYETNTKEVNKDVNSNKKNYTQEKKSSLSEKQSLANQKNYLLKSPHLSQTQSQITYGLDTSQQQPQISNRRDMQNQTQINYNKNGNINQNQTQVNYGSAISQNQNQINYNMDGNINQSQTQVSYGSAISQNQTQINYNKGGHVNQNQTQVSNGSAISQSQSQINYNKDGNTNPNQTQGSYGSAISQSQTQISYGDKGVQSQLQINHSNNASQVQSQIIESTTTKTNSQSSTKIPVSNNECKESGFMGDLNDCKKFYRCVDNGRGSYTRYEFTCGEGTLWDPSIESCNHAWAVKECGSTTESSSTRPTHSTESSTTNGDSTSTFSTTTLNHISEGPIKDQNNDIPNNNLDTSSTNKPIPTNRPESLDNIKCQSSGFFGDSSNCKKFYRCVDNGNGQYTRYEFSCGEGTVWDSKIEACNHPWAVEKCGGSQIGENNKEESTTMRETQSTQVSTQPTSNIPPVTDDYDSGYEQEPAQSSKPETTSTATVSTQSTTIISLSTLASQENKCKVSGFMGDSKDCKKFYRCVDNGNGAYTKYEFTCGEGTVWDSKIQSCNHAWAVDKCGEISTDDQNKIETTTIKEESTYTPQTITPGNENNTGYGEQSDNDLSATISSTSTTAANIEQTGNDICTNSGFMGDSQDCKKFYRCVDNGDGGFTKYEFTCGEGTVWDPNIDACNHAWAVKKCGGSSSSQHNETTTTEYTPIYHNENQDDEYNTEKPNQNSMTSTTSGTTVINSGMDSICQNSGFIGDNRDCKKFYRCVDDGKGGFNKYEFACGEGTVWDQTVESCNHEWAVKNCSSNGKGNNTNTLESTTESSLTSSTTSEDQEYNSQTTEGFSSTSLKPSGIDCHQDGFYADTNNCKIFYRCVDNGQGGYTKYEFTCGDGTYWDQEILACNHETSNTKCKSNEVETSSTTRKPSTENTESSTNQQGQSPQGTENENDDYTNGSTEKPSSTKNECTAEGFYPNEKDCKQFYRCVDNGKGSYTKYDFTCGEGTVWDSNLQTCNHIHKVTSCNNTNQSDNSISQTINDESTSSQSSSTTEGAVSESSKPNGDSCETEGYFGNTEDCTKFYRCVDDGKGGFTKYEFDCAEGTIWDQDVTTCNHPQDVPNPSCKSNQGGSTSSTENSTMSSTTTMSPANSETTSNGQNNSNQNNSSSTTETSNKNPDQDIKCEKAGFYADPNDCKKFYRCVDWDGKSEKFSVYHFECGEGTIWDPSLDTCNHEDSVYPPRNCSGNQSENVAQETTSSTEKTTTQSSTSSSQSTTENTTTEESTTTEQSTEKTTTEQSTTAKTTTEQSTTEKTTTEQSTTEKTTTEQSTTEKTTTEQLTPEKTTTEQSTTNENTTTEQATTSEKTTTEQATTSEKTTTEQTTTSEKTTTEQSVSSEQTTQETTQQSTTNEPTTQQTTTNEPTTQPSSTEQSTNDQTTTEQTTQAQTTEESTTLTTTNNQPTNDSTTTESSTTEKDESSTTESEQNTTTEENSSTDKECPETEDDQYLYVCPTSFKRHPKYCNMFYQCTEDEQNHDVKVATFTCPNDTIYDESQIKCVEEDKADKKCEGQKARKHKIKAFSLYSREPVVVDQHQHKCDNVGNYPFEKASECSPVFLKCHQVRGKLRGYVYQCPKGYVYWSISKRCEKTEKTKFCQLSKSRKWADKWEIPVEKHNLAK